MDHLQKFTSQFRDRLALLLLVNNVIIVADWWLADRVFELAGYWLLAALVIIPFLSLSILPWVSARYLIQPTKLIWQAILHIAPDTANVPAPDLRRTRLGKELITSLISHIYQLANVAENIEKVADSQAPDLRANFVANNLPLPLIVLDTEENILFANQALLDYIKQDASDVINKNIYSVLDMSFDKDLTFDAWLQAAKKNKAVATQAWERVRLTIPNGDTAQIKQFDLAVYYNQNNPQHLETILVLFDHSNQYRQDDQAMSYVALAVHELRTPLTLLRGYIEAFEEELTGKLDPQMQGFMQKMKASAQQLTAFVSNILNVARVENDQLVLQLREEQWPEILQAAVDDMRLRAEVRGIRLDLETDAKLPSVAVDRVSIYEVVNNLLDNAIKYSADSKKIIIKTYLSREGMIETTIQDFGVGIPENAMSNLFEKFYRNHRNRAQVGGTGLGLYLSKAIVTAHGGNIWVRSKEGEGSVFGFSVQPYSSLADKSQTKDNNGIVRSAHGWIKNHSLLRR